MKGFCFATICPIPVNRLILKWFFNEKTHNILNYATLTISDTKIS